MKSRIFIIAVTILMVSLISNVSAQKEKEDLLNMTKFQQVKISYDKKHMVTLEYVDAFSEGTWKMKVRIYEESGKLLYSDISRKKGDTRIDYDISQFPAGNYTFELYKNRVLVCSKTIVKQVSIANADQESAIKFNKSKLQQAQISYNSNDLVHIEYLDIFAEGHQKMEVKIYEESGELLYSKILDKIGDVKIDFDISQFPDGNYTFELFKNRESVCSELIVKQARFENTNTEMNLFVQADSIN